MRIKVCHIAVDVDHSLLLEATAKALDGEKYEFSAVFLNPERPAIADKLATAGFSTKWISYRSRKDLPRVLLALRKHFAMTKPSIVHTHLVDASLAGLTAALLAGISKRVHTRHHGSECHKYYPHGVYYDRFINRLSKRIVAISGVVKETLVKLEGVSPDKVSIINHGYDLADFAADDQTTDELKHKYGLNNCGPIIGVVSRLVHWKGIQYIIPAFAKFASNNPGAKLVLAGATGSYRSEIIELLNKRLLPDQYVLIEFEPRVFDLYRTFDVFVHTPIDRESEAFGQAYIEPLYLGIPSVFTLSGVANDFIRDEYNALVVPYCDPDAISAAMERLSDDDELRNRIKKAGREDVVARFGIDRLGVQFDELYSRL